MLFIEKIKFNNFRCFKFNEVQFKKGINVLIGDNGVGKTSVVEGISYFCLGKSFKSAKDKQVLHTNESFFNIIISSFSEKEDKTVISFDGEHKKIKQNEYFFKSLSDFVKNKIVTFSPDDLYIIKGSPIDRRRFLDIFISQQDNQYLKILKEYKKILKTRNELLKNSEEKQIDEILFDILSEKLFSVGMEVIKFREKYIKLLSEIIEKESYELSLGLESVKLEYKPNINACEYKKNSQRIKNVDLLAKTTTVGPHRDEIDILINNELAIEKASQGQIRTAVLAIKIAEYTLYKEKTENIIVCLDDVLSELDTKRQEKLLESINKGNQIFITAANLGGIPETALKNANIIKIERKGE